MHNSAYISCNRPLSKLLSYSVIILSLFTLSPIVNSHPAAPRFSKTELVHKAKEKTYYRYSILSKSPSLFVSSYTYKSALIFCDSAITVQYTKNKTLFHFFDQRKRFKYFIKNPSYINSYSRS